MAASSRTVARGIAVLIGHKIETDITTGGNLMVSHAGDFRLIPLESILDDDHPDIVELVHWIERSGCDCVATRLRKTAPGLARNF